MLQVGEELVGTCASPGLGIIDLLHQETPQKRCLSWIALRQRLHILASDPYALTPLRHRSTVGFEDIGELPIAAWGHTSDELSEMDDILWLHFTWSKIADIEMFAQLWATKSELYELIEACYILPFIEGRVPWSGDRTSEIFL